MTSWVSTEFTKVKGWAREVVARRVIIIGLVTILLHLAISYGWITPDMSDEALRLVTITFDALAAAVTIFTIRPNVTPTKDPRTDTGIPLVPINTVVPTNELATKDGPLDPTSIGIEPPSYA